MEFLIRLHNQTIGYIFVAMAMLIGLLIARDLVVLPAYFNQFATLPYYLLAGCIIAAVCGVFVALIQHYVEYWDAQPLKSSEYLTYSAITLIVMGWFMSVMINWLFLSISLIGIIDMFLLAAYTPTCSNCSKNLRDKKSYSVKSGRTYCETCFDRMGDDFLSYEIPEPEPHKCPECKSLDGELILLPDHEQDSPQFFKYKGYCYNCGFNHPDRTKDKPWVKP